MTKNIETTSEIQRRCSLNPDNNCEDCNVDTCPYIYCQKLDCLNCTSRMMCPMCNGKCTKCEYHAMCKIFQEKS